LRESTGLDALEDLYPHELPLLTPEHVAAIGEALKPFGCAAEPAETEQPRAEPRDDFFKNSRDHLNAKALDNLDLWVPQLDLYKCHRARGGYEAVATWRASNTGQPLEKRDLNLKIHPTGIRDFGDDRGYSALDLVMEVFDCSYGDAYDWLEQLVDPCALVIDTKAILADYDKKRTTAPKHAA
jgi:hypothetical protein